jgi:hypothetical protein
MTIEIDKDSYIVGMWFSNDPESNNDWLGCVIRHPDNPKQFKGWSRFRYVKYTSIFDSKDEKSWTTLTSAEGATEESMIRSMESVQKLLEPGYPDKDCMMVHGSLDKFMKLAKDKPWMNIQQVGIEEGKK